MTGPVVCDDDVICLPVCEIKSAIARFTSIRRYVVADSPADKRSALAGLILYRDLESSRIPGAFQLAKYGDPFTCSDRGKFGFIRNSTLKDCVRSQLKSDEDANTALSSVPSNVAAPLVAWLPVRLATLRVTPEAVAVFPAAELSAKLPLVSPSLQYPCREDSCRTISLYHWYSFSSEG